VDYASGGYTYWTDFLFQAMFAATAATIVSGAVAERIKLGVVPGVCHLFVAFVYPIAGSWKWGGGWLDNGDGFYDFAGSTLVHSVGGWGALVGAMLLGPRLGKFGTDGKVNPIPGTTCRWPRSACSCSGSAGSGSTAARCCRRTRRHLARAGDDLAGGRGGRDGRDLRLLDRSPRSPTSRWR
jgi:hypothetical protein